VLSQDGFVTVVVPLDEYGQLAAPPELISRGLVSSDDAQWLVEATDRVVKRTVHETEFVNPEELRKAVTSELSKYLYIETRRRPMVFTVVTRAFPGRQ
jgi:mRNA degradation ribonuclease J1/J2